MHQAGIHEPVYASSTPASKEGKTLRGDELGETPAYDTIDVIDILEDQQNYFAESFEAGMTFLREHYQVIILSQ